MSKQRLMEILMTALISAGIAVLQNILASYGHNGAVAINPLTVSVTGAIIHTARGIPLA